MNLNMFLTVTYIERTLPNRLSAFNADSVAYSEAFCACFTLNFLNNKCSRLKNKTFRIRKIFTETDWSIMPFFKNYNVIVDLMVSWK